MHQCQEQAWSQFKWKIWELLVAFCISMLIVSRTHFLSVFFLFIKWTLIVSLKIPVFYFFILSLRTSKDMINVKFLF